MSYKGHISVGSEVTVELDVDPSARGIALLWAAASTARGAVVSGKDVVSPGGRGRVRLTPRGAGVLKIEADLSDDADRARLVVSVGGTVRDDTRIVGDTRWTYAVE